jgi:hypothetical protein
VAVRGGGTGTGRRIAVEADAQRFPLLVGHHGEVELDAGHAVERADGRGHAVLDLLAQRAARHGEGDEDADGAVVPQVDVAHHAQLDDRAPELRILHRPERFDDLLSGRHGAPRPCLGVSAVVAAGGLVAAGRWELPLRP